MPSRKPTASSRSSVSEALPVARLIPNEHHPDFVGESDHSASAPAPMPPDPGPPPELIPPPVTVPRPEPDPTYVPSPRWPPLPCRPVSGRYAYVAQPISRPFPPGIPPIQARQLLRIIVRVDVDRFFPQDVISVEATRLFPPARAHAIAAVTSDRCLGLNARRIEAAVTYRDGDASLVPADVLVFEAKPGRGSRYVTYSLTAFVGGARSKSYPLVFQSSFFDPVEFEIDRVENASATTSYDTGTHSNRPPDLPLETLTLATAYQRAGFDVAISPNTSVIPIADAGANGTWSDSEMHNAMVAYWSRFADRPQWALWVLFAARHDTGRSLGGVMFDDIGPNHRQGTAIFTDSFIQDAPAGDTEAAAWRQRMAFWTAVHEMGHAFNLAHSWQKSLGVAQGAPGDPWIPLPDEPEARSFMNYPFRVSGGEEAFFSDFRFRFTDDELRFMRHAPRRFVQMGNSDWFVNHGLEAPAPEARPAPLALTIRPNRDVNTYRFLEPVTMELKLTNRSSRAVTVDPELLTAGGRLSVFIQREGGLTRQWSPLITRCLETRTELLKPGESLYGAHLLSVSPQGWLIHEPGFYKVQATIDTGEGLAISNVLRLWVSPSSASEENGLAADYFTEDVGRVLAFGGAPALSSATSTLQSLVARCPSNPAAVHATIALSAPLLRDYKLLEIDATRAIFAIRSRAADVTAAVRAQTATLVDSPDRAAETLGHIDYFGTIERLVDGLASAGDPRAAAKVMQSSVGTMKKRAILPAVIQSAERKLSRLK